MFSDHIIEGHNFDVIFYKLLRSINEKPQYTCSPRGSLIKENLAVTLILDNPRARRLTSQKRLTNYGFGVGEFLWYWQGKQDLATMVYYNKRMKDFSDDGKTLNSAYGHRIKKATFEQDKGFPTFPNASQWEACIETLCNDPDSRRALLLINWPGDNVHAAYTGSKDVPCTLSLQFFIRDGKLDLHGHMRSNDVMWGLTYDLFSFTLFQECMLNELKCIDKFKNLELGKYYHTAGSIHLYEQHFEQAREIVKEYQETWNDLKYSCNDGDLMDPVSMQDIESLCVDEHRLRTLDVVHSVDATGYGKSASWMLEQLVNHRAKRKLEESK